MRRRTHLPPHHPLFLPFLPQIYLFIQKSQDSFSVTTVTDTNTRTQTLFVCLSFYETSILLILYSYIIYTQKKKFFPLQFSIMYSQAKTERTKLVNPLMTMSNLILSSDLVRILYISLLYKSKPIQINFYRKSFIRQPKFSDFESCPLCKTITGVNINISDPLCSF